MARKPNPLITEYYIRRIRYKADVMGHVSAEYTSRGEEVINTVDIENVLKEPNTFLTGWLEQHYEDVQSQVSGQIIERFKEYHIRKNHPINDGLLMSLSLRVMQAKDDLNISVRHIRSFEQILFSKGWRFKLTPIGTNEEAIDAFDIPDTFKEGLEQEPEFMMSQATEAYAQEQKILANTEHAMQEQDQQQPVPASFSPEQAGLSQRVSMLESGVGTLHQKMDMILEAMLNAQGSNGAGNGEPCSPGFERDEARFPEPDTHQRPASPLLS